MSRQRGFGGTLRAKQEPTEDNVKTERPSLDFLTSFSAEQERQQAREELKQMPLLAPWTRYKAHESSFTDELNRELAQRVHDQVLDKLSALRDRLEQLQAQRENSGVLPMTTLDTLLQSRLIVEAKRKVIPAQIAENTIAAIRAASLHIMPATPLETAMAANIRREHRSNSVVSMAATSKNPRVKQSTIISPRLRAVTADIDVSRRRHRSSSAAKYPLESDTIDHDEIEDARRSTQLLCVQFPSHSEVATSIENNDDSLEKDEEQQAIHFRSRPVAPSAVDDAGTAATKRESHEPRVRYIMSTRLGAVPPSKGILDEYPIPKEVLDALERHRHFHVDDFSPLTAFEPLQLPPRAPTEPDDDAPRSTGVNAEWECFYRQSVPLERSPVSFVLASLAVAREKPLPASSDLFHQQALVGAAADDTLLLQEARRLYDSTHDAHRDFRAELHRHLDLQYLVDLSFRSSLTSASYFVDDEDESEQTGGGDAEPSVQIPTHLRRQRTISTANSEAGTTSKWKFLLNGVHRMAHRRGAVSVLTKSEAAVRTHRSDLLVQLCTLTPQDVEFLTLWYGYSPDVEAEAIATADSGDGEGGVVRLDPVPMIPYWSARFELAWKQLALSTTERLDLAIKYSSLGYSTRLPDAVTLWETAGALITEHEDLLRLMRSTLTSVRRHANSLSEDTAMLQALIASAAHVREILLLTYVEVGDFVTFQGNFYLAKLERDTTEIRRLMEEDSDAKSNQLQPATATK